MMKADRRGFTTMEMLISLAIFGVVTAFLMANFRTGKAIDELRLASNGAVSALRQAQTRAISGSTVNVCRGGEHDGKLCSNGAAKGCVGGTCSPEVPRGYGVRFSKVGEAAGRAVVFADLDGTKSYSTDEDLQVLELSPSSNVAVTSFDPYTYPVVDVVFEPPRPTVYFNGSVNETVVLISLEHEISGQVRTLRVNRVSGQVSSD